MNREEIEVFTALGDLTNGALNYYKTSKSILLKDEIIRRYLEKLQQENKQLKEEIKELREVRLKAPTAHEIDHLDCWRMSSRQ